MNALEKITLFYHWIILTKLISTLGLSITLLVITSIQLCETNNLRFDDFIVGALVSACLSFVYQIKRLCIENEYLLLEIPRLFPLSWAIYGTIVFNNASIVSVVILYIVGVLNLVKMEYPIGNNGMLRV